MIGFTTWKLHFRAAPTGSQRECFYLAPWGKELDTTDPQSAQTFFVTQSGDVDGVPSWRDSDRELVAVLSQVLLLISLLAGW
jgi:hypothetical protein